MCGLDFKLWEQQTAEKKILKQKSRSNDSSGGLQLEGPGVAASANDSDRKIVGECPKCSFPRLADVRECPQCGVIYEKHEQLLAKKAAEERARKEAEERRFAEERARIQREAEKGIAEERAKRQKEALRKSVEMKVPVEQIPEADTTPPEMEAAPEPTPIPEMERQPEPKQRDSLVQSPRKALTIFLIGIALLAAIGCTISVMRYWQAKVERERLVAEQAAAQRRLSEEQQKIAYKFRDNKTEIIGYLRSLIDGRKFSLFEEESRRYAIPTLKGELDEVNDYLEEIKLFDTTKEIPADDYQRNYDTFFRLGQMDPENKVYAEKLGYYRKKYAEENFQVVKNFLKKKNPSRAELEVAMACIEKVIELEGNTKESAKALSALKTAELLFFEGNEKVRMAVRNDGVTGGATGGQRKIYVWIKNVGSESFFINIDFFTMIGKDEKTYKYNHFSRELVAELQSGGIAQGYIYFYTRVEPKELIFDHINAGTISRIFP